jgi:hypothetical protein
MVSPARRRAAAEYLVRRHGISERRACALVGQHRSTQRYRPLVPLEEATLVRAMNAHAARHPRWGYRAVWTLLRQTGWAVNRKRIERLWRLEGHRLPPRQKSGKRAQGSGENSSRNRPALAVNHTWSYDFVSAHTRRSGPIRILNVVDEFSRRSLGSRVSRSIGAAAVVPTPHKTLRDPTDTLSPFARTMAESSSPQAWSVGRTLCRGGVHREGQSAAFAGRASRRPAPVVIRRRIADVGS